MAAAALFGLVACQADMDAPALVEPVASMTPNTSLAEFKTTFADQTVLCPAKEDGSHYILHGRVVSSDATGNIYKSIVIQDETAALAISVNQGSTYTDYRLGQEIVIDATGLYIGYYNGLQQLGWYDLYEGAPSLTFMAWDIFQGHTELNGFPNTDMQYVTQDESTWTKENPYTVVTSIGQLPSAGEEFRNMQSQLVEFRNVYFVDGGKETYAPYQESVNRTIKDAAGNEIICRTSGYSNFYNDIIPEGTGNVRGILSYYGDAWQLLLRSTYDVMIGTKGQKDDPYTVAEAIEAQDNGAAGWVTGYIVGTVAAGVQTVTSNDNIIWSDQAELPNNLVIAASPDVTDWTQCIVVDLPLGSAFRESANMVEHPDVYKKEILVSGNLSTLYGMPGIADNGGTGADVEIDGITIAGGNTGGSTEGNGTQESPYTIEQVMNSTADETGVWIEGYVVGYVSDMTWPATAVFGTTATDGSTNYTNATNCILSSEAPANASSNNSVPCGLSSTGDVRATLGISKNPSIYGQKVKVKGDITKYFGTRGIKNVTEYDLDGTGGGGETPTPTPGGDGDGTVDSPYSVEYIMGTTADATGIWVEGYVVGYASGSTWDTAVFGTQATDGSTNYTNGTNCILSAVAPGSASSSNSIPCGLANTGDVRATLAISKNPAIYGQKVKVKGDLTKYFGVRGIKNVTEYVLDGGGSTPDPTPSGNDIYAGLSSDANGWTFDNISMAEGLSYVWQWDATYKNLKGNAFVGGAHEAESVAVSPEISLAGYTTAQFTFEHAASYQTILKTMCYPVIREVGQTSWTKLEVTTWPAAGGWTFVNAGTFDISSYAGKKVQIGFHYGSTAANADTWEIRNFSVTGSK